MPDPHASPHTVSATAATPGSTSRAGQRLHFTKMNGAGNDFVMLDAVRTPLALEPAQVRHLADRRFGVGADQILLVEPPSDPAFDFRYRIFNADGSQAEHCGNGARCFYRFVRAVGLTRKQQLRVQTSNGAFEVEERDGQVRVNMGAPRLDPATLPFAVQGLTSSQREALTLWSLPLGETAQAQVVQVAAVSMGNPHAVMLVDDVEHYPVAELGPRIEAHPRFVKHVNAGFVQVLDRNQARLRVYERGAGETLACGTGACAAMVAARLAGLVEAAVQFETRGGLLSLEWQGGASPVWLAGPAETVFVGDIDL